MNLSPKARYQAFLSSTARILFALSLLSGTIYFLVAPLSGIGPGPESFNLARNLVEHGTFANPYHSLPTGTSAHMAPLYPLMLAAFLSLFGNTAAFNYFIFGWNIVTQALMVAMLPSFSRSLFGKARPGIVASALYVALPLHLIWPHWEAITVCFGTVLFCILTRRIAKAPLRTDVLAGAATGVLLLLNPATIIPCCSWLVFALRRAPRPRILRLALAGGAAIVFICLPWTVRNYLQFHALIPIRDNFGMELYVSNRDGAGPTYIENITRNPNMPHANSNTEEARLVRDMGEYAYNRDRQARAWRWIRDHPGEFASLSLLRIERFWFPLPIPMSASSWSVWVVTVVSAAGLILLIARRNAALWFLAPVLVLYPLPYYLVNNDARLRYPILWISVLCAGFALSALFAKLRKPHARTAARIP